MAVKLSLCMIVKDEEDVLARCLSSVLDFVDEIVIADTGSRDNTKEIAKTFTDNVYDFPWNDDFSAARNFSFSKATGDYAMWLDADDVIDKKNALLFCELKKLLERDGPDTVMCRYNVGFDEQGKPNFTYYRERILKRSPARQWKGFVHECIAPYGKIIYSDCAVDHKKIKEGNARRNLELYQKAIFNQPLQSAREKYYYGRELYYNRLYREAVCVLEDALTDPTLWRINAAEACSILCECHQFLRNDQKALAAAFRSFSYGTPRAEMLCAIGSIFKNKADFASAAYWYSLAITAPENGPGGFSRPEYKDFVPFLELSVCYYHLNRFDEAKKYHEKAKALRPNHPSILSNERYFS